MQPDNTAFTAIETKRTRSFKGFLQYVHSIAIGFVIYGISIIFILSLSLPPFRSVSLSLYFSLAFPSIEIHFCRATEMEVFTAYTIYSYLYIIIYVCILYTQSSVQSVTVLSCVYTPMAEGMEPFYSTITNFIGFQINISVIASAFNNCCLKGLKMFTANDPILFRPIMYIRVRVVCMSFSCSYVPVYILFHVIDSNKTYKHVSLARRSSTRYDSRKLSTVRFIYQDDLIPTHRHARIIRLEPIS